VQFLKRFYIANSPMNYHPKQIFPAALFLATKTETAHLPLSDFIEQLKKLGNKKASREEVLAPEFLVTQALRFNFDVRHPFRAIKGVYMELRQLMVVAKGGHAATPPWIRIPVNELIGQLLRLPKDRQEKKRPSILNSGKPIEPMLPRDFEERVNAAHAAARETTRGPALLSDAYFLYTPSQISLAAFWLADRPLTEYYLSLKLDHPLNAVNSSATANGIDPKKPKILDAIRECAALLNAQANRVLTGAGEVDKKLRLARNPEKRDLVKLNSAQKRDAGEDGRLDENVAKKRRLDREKTEKDANDLFGPALVMTNGRPA
jgi:cyclin H